MDNTFNKKYSMIFNGVYKDKTVLITGHTGFKGSWLSLWLKRLGANVIGYSLPPATNPNNFDSAGLKEKIINYFGDTRDTSKITEVVKKHAPEFIFHLASQPIVRKSYLDPKETYEINLIGLINILEAIRINKLPMVFINITTDKCYENKEWIWPYREIDTLGGYDPYSASKACSEIITSSYRNSFFNEQKYFEHKVAVATVRAGNVIGGGDWSEDRIIPDCVRSLSMNKPIVVRNPNAIRPWQHVLEPLAGYLWLGAKMFEEGEKYCSAWNFGSIFPKNINVLDLVKLVIDLWGNGTFKVDSKESNLHEANYLKLDSHKAINNLKWEPVLDIKKTIEMTALWYKRYYSGEKDSFKLCNEQIDEYEKLAKEKNLYGM